MSPRPPDRWSRYGPMGDVITGTNFVAFKVPLKQQILYNVRKQHRFGPEDAIQKIKDKGKVLGLVIDVTYTDKYYDRGEFGRHSIEYEKIYAGGHVVPADNIIYRFFDVVEKFKKRTTNKDVVIGVHCTHGVNRTGYIVCRYMIERLGFDPTEAMKAFNEARGHKIERKNYIDDLLTRKHNPDYVIGDHPPVFKEEFNGGNNKRHSKKHRTGPPQDTRDIPVKQQDLNHHGKNKGHGSNKTNSFQLKSNDEQGTDQIHSEELNHERTNRKHLCSSEDYEDRRGYRDYGDSCNHHQNASYNNKRGYIAYEDRNKGYKHLNNKARYGCREESKPYQKPTKSYSSNDLHKKTHISHSRPSTQ